MLPDVKHVHTTHSRAAPIASMQDKISNKHAIVHHGTVNDICNTSRSGPLATESNKGKTNMAIQTGLQYWMCVC